jgi:hypothetical protein
MCKPDGELVASKGRRERYAWLGAWLWKGRVAFKLLRARTSDKHEVCFSPLFYFSVICRTKMRGAGVRVGLGRD